MKPHANLNDAVACNALLHTPAGSQRQEAGVLMATLGIVPQEAPRFDAESFGEGLEGGDVNAFQRGARQHPVGRWLRYSGPLGELVGRRPALPLHRSSDVVGDHGANSSVSRGYLTSTNASVSILVSLNRTPQ